MNANRFGCKTKTNIRIIFCYIKWYVEKQCVVLARTDFASGERGSPLQIIHYFYCIKSYVYKHINSSMWADNIHHYRIVQTVAILRSGINVFLHYKLSTRIGNGGSPCGRIISTQTGCGIIQNLGSSWCQASLFCTVSKNNSHSSNPFQSLAWVPRLTSRRALF